MQNIVCAKTLLGIWRMETKLAVLGDRTRWRPTSFFSFSYFRFSLDFDLRLRESHSTLVKICASDDVGHPPSTERSALKLRLSTACSQRRLFKSLSP